MALECQEGTHAVQQVRPPTKKGSILIRSEARLCEPPSQHGTASSGLTLPETAECADGAERAISVTEQT
jgi:hypothetical protein